MIQEKNEMLAKYLSLVSKTDYADGHGWDWSKSESGFKREDYVIAKLMPEPEIVFEGIWDRSDNNDDPKPMSLEVGLQLLKDNIAIMKTNIKNAEKFIEEEESGEE